MWQCSATRYNTNYYKMGQAFSNFSCMFPNPNRIPFEFQKSFLITRSIFFSQYVRTILVTKYHFFSRKCFWTPLFIISLQCHLITVGNLLSENSDISTSNTRQICLQTKLCYRLKKSDLKDWLHGIKFSLPLQLIANNLFLFFSKIIIQV